MITLRRNLTLPVFFLFLFVASPVHAERDPLEGFDAYIRTSMADWQVPGLAIAIVKDDAVVFIKGYGVREVGKDAPVDERTVFPLSSLTKAFTAAAVGILVDEGKLSWDDPVINHLPSFQPPDPSWKRDVTLRDLLSHRASGRFRYSNPGYKAAGEVVAAVSGMSWGDFVQSHILRPLEMNSATTNDDVLWDAENVRPCYECDLPGRTVGFENARIENIVMLHVLSESGLRPIPWHPHGSHPAGDINANVEDVTKWMRLQLGKGVYGGKRILSAAVIEEMLNAQVLASARYPYVGPGSGHFWTYGLGWYLTDYRGRKAAMHSGSGTGCRSFIALLPEENVGVAVLTNMHRGLSRMANDLPDALAFRVLDAYLGAPERDLSRDLLSKARAEAARHQRREQRFDATRVKGTQPSLPLETYAGTYTNPTSGEAKIVEENGTLVVQYANGMVGDLSHWHYDVFRVNLRGPNQYKGSFLIFTLDPAGRVAEFRFDLPRVTRLFKRVPDDSKAAGSPR